MMLLTELIKEGRRTVSEAYPEAEAREMASVFLEELLGVRKHTHILYPDYSYSFFLSSQSLFILSVLYYLQIKMTCISLLFVRHI